jgi:hypothetical protein
MIELMGYTIDLYDMRTREHSARRLLRLSQGHQLKQIFFLSSRSSDNRCAQVYICEWEKEATCSTI